MAQFGIGDEIEIVYEDSPDDTHRATVVRFQSDEEEGMAPEIEDYVACWIEITLIGVPGETANQSVILETDSRYVLNGRHVQLRKI
jgi:hypothetical protein